MEREFEIGEHMLKEECLVCKQKLKLKEKIVLCPIQKPREGFANVVSIPIHVDCYWIEKEN